MKKILLTGFEPFHGQTLNSSQQIVLGLADRFRDVGQFLILPVSYERSFEVLKAHIEAQTDGFILMLGQAAGRGNVSLERIAINLMDSEKSDEDQVFKIEQKIHCQGPDGYMSDLPLSSWLQILKSENLPVEISNTAGTFVCNALYYRVLAFLRERQSRCQALFIHVPSLTEAPSLSLEMMQKTIERLIQEILGQGR